MIVLGGEGMRSTRNIGIALASTLLFAGCYEGAAQHGDIESRFVVGNASKINTFVVNSSKLGAFNINGVRFGVINGVKWSVINGVKFGTGYNINGTRLDSVTIDGADYTDFQVEGSTLVGTVLQNGEEVELSGTEMIGTVFGLTIASVDEEGNDVEVRRRSGSTTSIPIRTPTTTT
ncbi:MAG: hypothetical protein H6710_21555 [Myxococcales bacterium]|nr:hypothetical protein [Myxococcales bacterium]